MNARVVVISVSVPFYVLFSSLVVRFSMLIIGFVNVNLQYGPLPMRLSSNSEVYVWCRGAQSRTRGGSPRTIY